MTRSGIKQGLAVSAVAALATVGLPAAAHAVAGTAATYTVTPSATSVSAGEEVTFDVLAKDGAGVDTTGTFSYSISEALPSGKKASDFTVHPDDLNVTPDPAGTGDDSFTDAGWASSAAGVATGDDVIDFVPTVPGTVKVTTTDSTGAIRTFNITVGGGQSGDASVKAISASSSSFDLYENDLAKTKLTVKPTDGTYGVAGANIVYSVDGGAPVIGALSTDALSSAGVDYNVDASAALAGLSAGSHTIRFWVDEVADGNSNGKFDANEPNAIVTVNVAASPVDTTKATTADNLSRTGGQDFTAKGGFANSFPNDAAAAVGAKFVLKNNGVIVKNASVKFDVYAGPASMIGDPTTPAKFQMRLSGTTNDKGEVSISAPLTAAQVKDLADNAGGVLSVQAFVSKSSAEGVGTLIGTGGFDVAHFIAPAVDIAIQGAADSDQKKIAVTRGSAVTVNLVVKDQFGRPLAGRVLRVTGGTQNLAPAAPHDLLPATNAQGQTSFSYTDTKSTGVGTSDTFTFTDVVPAGATADVQQVEVDYVASVTAASIVPDAADWVSTDTTQTVAAAAGTQKYTVAVKSANNVPLPGTKVTFSVDNGFVSASASGKGTSKTLEAITDDSGEATVYLGSTKAGKQTLTATSGGAKAVNSGTITYSAGSAYGIQIAPIADLTVGASAKVTASLTDEFGNGVAGKVLTFSQSGAAGALGGGASSVDVTTAVDGTASTTLNALSVVGTGSITVTPKTASDIAGPEDTSGDATVAFYKAPVVVNYTVAAKPTPEPQPQPQPQPHPQAHVTINKATAKSQGKKDVLTVRAAHANGKRVVVKFHGKRVGHGVVKHGKVVIKVNDKNGNKKSRYQVIIAGVKKFVGTK